MAVIYSNVSKDLVHNASWQGVKDAWELLLHIHQVHNTAASSRRESWSHSI